MIDHVSIAVSDLGKAARFHERGLEPLGLVRMAERPARVGFGHKYPEFWLEARPRMAPAADGTGAHVALRAPSRAAVDAFHASALALGARCDGSPGERPVTVTTCYAAFIRDADGNRIEAVAFPREDGAPAP